MGPNRKRPWLARGLGCVVAVFAAAVFAPVASAYWDFSGNLPQYQYHHEYTGTGGWENRLSRQYCGTRKYFYPVGGGIWMVPAPNGCDTSDWTTGYWASDYNASECYNLDGPTMWVNCRIARIS
jgi:hypothetical protein